MTKQLFTKYMKHLADITFKKGIDGYVDEYQKLPDTFIEEMNKHELWSGGQRDNGFIYEPGAFTAYEMANDYSILDTDLCNDKEKFTSEDSSQELKDARKYLGKDEMKDAE